MRFDLLECETCGARTWTVDNEPPPDHQHHVWWSRHTFHAESNGPGLEPTQTTAPADPTPLWLWLDDPLVRFGSDDAPDEREALALGCRCEWTGQSIRRFNRACPTLRRHRFKSDGIVEWTDGTIQNLRYSSPGAC